MKIREGFVSNSSSSSFILGKDSNTVEVTAEELIDRLNQGAKPVDFLIISDTYEGVDAFELTNEMGYLVKNYSDRFLKYGKDRITHIFYCVSTFCPDYRSWETEQYGKDEGLAEGESCIWVNYETIGGDHCYDSETQFFKKYFLSDDEWYFVEDDYDDSYICARHKNKTCVYSEKIELADCDISDIDAYDTIGFNEDITCLYNDVMFVYKKLTKEDKETIKSKKQDFKKEVFFYKDFEVLNKNNSFKALESKVYTVATLSGIIEKSKKIDVFITEDIN